MPSMAGHVQARKPEATVRPGLIARQLIEEARDEGARIKQRVIESDRTRTLEHL